MRPLALLVLPLAIVAAAASARAQSPRQVLEKKVIVAAPAAAVWRAFTTVEGAATFFAPSAKIELRLDGAYELYFDPEQPAGKRGSEGQRVLSYLPERMLSFTWNAPPQFPRARAERGMFVVVQLEQLGGPQGTRVTLTHLGFKPGTEGYQIYTYFERAWGLVLSRLQRRFATGPLDWKNPDGKH